MSARRAFHVAAAAVGAALATAVPGAPVRAQPSGRPAAGHRAEVEPGLYVLSVPRANLVVLVRRDSAVVVGPQLPALVDSARALLASRHVAGVRFVLVTPADSAVVYGDGGWGRSGAVVLAHEALRYRMMRRAAAHPDSGGRASQAAPPHASRPRASLPSLGFSEVVQLDVGGSEVHAIRQRPGATAADAAVHFEDAATVYLGEVFTADGYPALDVDQGGSINAMIETVAFFRQFPAGVHFVPGRGPVATVRDLQAYGDMLVTVRDRVQRLVTAGRTGAEVVAAKPTADLGGVWGRGPVGADQFVTAVYRSLTTKH